MLCQALLPTIAYAATAANAGALASVSRSFGLGRICSVANLVGQGPQGQSGDPSHGQSAHCPLCLAHALAAGLPAAELALPRIPPVAVGAIAADPVVHLPIRASVAWARAPPASV